MVRIKKKKSYLKTSTNIPSDLSETYIDMSNKLVGLRNKEACASWYILEKLSF